MSQLFYYNVFSTISLPHASSPHEVRQTANGYFGQYIYLKTCFSLIFKNVVYFFTIILCIIFTQKNFFEDLKNPE